MARLSYFAKDGNYGDASGITIIDTVLWDESDFGMVEQASDEDRALVARLISEWIGSGRTDEYDEYFERLGIEKTSR